MRNQSSLDIYRPSTRIAGDIVVGAIIAGAYIVGAIIAGAIVAGVNFVGAFVAEQLSRSNYRRNNYRRSIMSDHRFFGGGGNIFCPNLLSFPESRICWVMYFVDHGVGGEEGNYSLEVMSIGNHIVGGC